MFHYFVHVANLGIELGRAAGPASTVRGTGSPPADRPVQSDKYIFIRINYTNDNVALTRTGEHWLETRDKPVLYPRDKHGENILEIMQIHAESYNLSLESYVLSL